MNNPSLQALILIMILVASASMLYIPSPPPAVRVECTSPKLEFILHGDILVNKTFLHSVHLVPIYDIYRWNGSGWILVEHWTGEFGAGEPDSPLLDEGGGTVVYIPSKGMFRFYGFERPMGRTLLFNTHAYLSINVTISGTDGSVVLGDANCTGTILIHG